MYIWEVGTEAIVVRRQLRAMRDKQGARLSTNFSKTVFEFSLLERVK